MRTGFLLDTLNKPAADHQQGAHTVDVATRVARLVRSHLADSYLEPAMVAGWMSALSADPAPIAELAACLAKAPPPAGYGDCFDGFVGAAVVVSRWGVPEAPASIDNASPAVAEVDAERFLSNAMAIGPSLAALRHVLGAPIAAADMQQGLARGANEAASYVKARKWHRSLQRRSNALVLSGGAANGAFSAGAVFRLFEILDACRGEAAPDGCGDSRIDLVAGNSTGSLIGVLVDMYFTPGRQKAARDLLLANYTCTVESDLYCLHSTWDWNLADDVRGLVRFDGIEARLSKAIDASLAANDTELVTVSVDYASGDVYGISDQDPADFGPAGNTPAAVAERKQGRINAVVASIVEPVVAEPIDWLPAHGARVKGTFSDGGVRAGLPVLQALQRGAERVMVLANSSVEPARIADPANAFKILMRSIDLMSGQPEVGEVQQAEFGAVVRRFAEYNVCSTRLQSSAGASGIANINTFCARKGPGFLPVNLDAQAQGAESLWMGPPRFEQVATSWRSSWVYRPEKSEHASAEGYSFSPSVMRPLFEDGVATFQERCSELLDLFEIRGRIAATACAEPVASVVARAKASFADEASCSAGKPARRTCP